MSEDDQFRTFLAYLAQQAETNAREFKTLFSPMPVWTVSSDVAKRKARKEMRRNHD